jgi:hypothetical protein
MVYTKLPFGIHAYFMAIWNYLLSSGIFFLFFSLVKKRLPRVGSEPGSSQFHLFSHFHHFTAEPQWLPSNFFLSLDFVVVRFQWRGPVAQQADLRDALLRRDGVQLRVGGKGRPLRDVPGLPSQQGHLPGDCSAIMRRKSVGTNRGPFLTSPLAPRREICSLGEIFTPSLTPRGEHYVLFRRMEGQTENSTPRG